MASRVGVPLGRGATPIGPHQCVFLLFHGTHQILEHLCITMYHLATLSHLCLLLVGTLGRSAGAETAPSATGRVWEQVDPDAELSVVSLSTQELGVHNFGKARLEFPHIMFNDAMGDVSRGFREYARIDKRIARRKPQAVALTYELTFSPDYEWSANGRLGGLLPGIAGGKSRRQWRVQLAWDPEGRIKVSKNLPRENRGGGKAVIETPPDAFWKPSPEKNHVRVIVKQNSKRKRNGTLDVSVNGRQLATLANVVFDWRGRGRSKFVLREGRYLGPNPTRGREEVRFLSTTNLKVSGVDVKIELPDVWWVDDSETPLPAPSAPVSTPETPPASQEPEDAVVGDPVPSPVSDPVPSPESRPEPTGNQSQARDVDMEHEGAEHRRYFPPSLRRGRARAPPVLEGRPPVLVGRRAWPRSWRLRLLQPRGLEVVRKDPRHRAQLYEESAAVWSLQDKAEPWWMAMVCLV